MTHPSDVVEFCEKWIAKNQARERKVLARIRRALASLRKIRAQLARDRREHAIAVEKLIANKEGSP